jgi:mercuric ion transport protein
MIDQNKSPIPPVPNNTHSGKWAGGGIFASFFAFVGASCCVLPIILVNIGVSSSLVAHLGFFARYEPIFMGLAIAMIMAGFYYAFKNGRRPPRRILILLVLATLLVLSAYILPHYEGAILRNLNMR